MLIKLQMLMVLKQIGFIINIKGSAEEILTNGEIVFSNDKFQDGVNFLWKL